MFGRLYRIFGRYRDENLRLESVNPCVATPDGRALLRIDRIVLRCNRLVVEGWTNVPRVGLRLNRILVWETPELLKPGEAMRGFTLDLPFEVGRTELLLAEPESSTAEEAITPILLPAFSGRRLFWARNRLWIPYLAAVAGLLLHIWRWKVGGDFGAREVIKERLGLVSRSEAVEMSGAVLDVAPSCVEPATASSSPAQSYAAATVVMPIFNAFDTLPDALDRADAYADLPLRLILVEDCSTDPQIRPFLALWARAPGRRADVRLILNESNLGFIGTVNRGFAVARDWPDDPVILLNSDALLPQGWTRRLLAPLASKDVASVTPMSNNAEIFNVPVICQPSPLTPGLADRLDAAACRLKAQESQVEAPTGVGFCMALSPAFLARVPEFDTAFGRGYGEETDWCQKTRALGGRHLGLANLFVEHRGGTSFGSEAKRKLLERNGAEISRRYPHYDREVQEFIRHDPMVTTRLALGLTWAGELQDAPVPVYLAHAMGGGAENDLRHRIGRDIATGGAAVVLRVGQGHRWKLELHSRFGLTQGLTNDTGLIRKLIARLAARRIVYSCGVGDRDPLSLPDLLLDLAGRGAQPLPGGPQEIELLVHDFFMISPSYTLLGDDGQFHGLPLPGSRTEGMRAHRADRPGGRPATLAEWQAAWGRLVVAARQITVFSESSRRLMAEAFPAAAGRVRVCPHALLADIPRINPSMRLDGRPVIGVLGNIGQQKGAAVVQALSQDLARLGTGGLVVIGQMDPAYRLAPPAMVHGSYEWRDLPGLVERYGISAWLIPSVWPETFSFTTHEAIATKMPVFCFDLGAQGEALREALRNGTLGAVLPLGIDIENLISTLYAVPIVSGSTAPPSRAV